MRLLLLLGVTLLTIVQTSSPNLLSSTRSIFTKTYSIDTNNLQSDSIKNQKNTSFTLNYQQTIESSRLISFISLNKLAMDNKYKQIKIIVYLTNFSSTCVNVIVFSAKTSLITKLAIRVYVAGGFYSDPKKFVVGQTQLNPNKAIWSYNKSINLTQQLKIVDTLRIFHSLTGFSISQNKTTNSNGNLIDIGVTVRLVNSSSLKINLFSTYVSFVEFVRADWLIFYLQPNSLANFSLLSSRLTNLQTQKSYQLSSYKSQYFYLEGMTGFSIRNNMQFNFQFKEAQSDKISMSSSSKFMVFSYNILSFVPYFCVQNSLASDLIKNCYSKCPLGYYPDSNQFSCKACLPQCQTCSQKSACTFSTNSQISQQDSVPPSLNNLSTQRKNFPSSSSSSSSSSPQINQKQTDSSLAIKIVIVLASCILLAIISVLLYRKFCFKPIQMIQMLRIQEQTVNNQNDFNRPQMPAMLNNTEPISEAAKPFRIKKISKSNFQWQIMPKQYVYPKELECTIDLLQKPTLRMNCSHYFHIKCIIAWKKRNGNCPLCRKKIEDVCNIHCQGCFDRYREISLKVIEKDIAKTKQQQFRLCDDCL